MFLRKNLVGEENKGWDYAKFLLGNERTGVTRVGFSKTPCRHGKEKARGGSRRNRHPPRGSVVRGSVRRVGKRIACTGSDSAASGGEFGRRQAESGVLAAQASWLRIAAGSNGIADGCRRPGFTAGRHRADIDSPEWAQQAAPRYLNYRKVSIYSGSSEVQRSIIASSILGL